MNAIIIFSKSFQDFGNWKFDRISKIVNCHVLCDISYAIHNIFTEHTREYL